MRDEDRTQPGEIGPTVGGDFQKHFLEATRYFRALAQGITGHGWRGMAWDGTT